MFLLYLDAVSVTNNKGPDITHSLHMQFSTKARWRERERERERERGERERGRERGERE